MNFDVETKLKPFYVRLQDRLYSKTSCLWSWSNVEITGDLDKESEFVQSVQLLAKKQLFVIWIHSIKIDSCVKYAFTLWGVNLNKSSSL